MVMEEVATWSASDCEFGDLLEDLEDATPHGLLVLRSSPSSSRADAEKFGAWRMRQVIQEVVTQDIIDLGFPVALVDPAFLTCPVVLASRGFAALTGCELDRVAGHSWEKLLRPSASTCPSAFSELRRLCEDAASGQWYPSGGMRGRAILHMDDVHVEEQLPEGELCFAHAFAAPSGARAKCISHFKQVSLDDKMYILCLQSPLELSTSTSGQEADASDEFEKAMVELWDNMETALQSLAARFWLSSSLFRQRQTTRGGRLAGEAVGQPLSVF